MTRHSAFRCAAFAVALAAVWVPATRAGREPASGIFIDASRIPPAPRPLPFAAGGRSPAGRTITVNSRYFVRDGRPWFPVMGEFHYTRYPASGWEQELLKMKAGGVEIVSTYIFWIHHEEIEGQFDWSGRRDLRRFVELCAKHGLLVWIRVGPWDHGEVRNGGLPDWVLKKSHVRENDPAYLGYVRRFYGQIGQQTRGLFWKDGGPIIGVQIENEYHGQGPGKGQEHMLTLLRIAREAGLDAPLYSATAWDDAVVPSRGVLPVFGGYADQFWARSLAELPPNPNYFFTGIRCEENVGANLRSKRPDIGARYARYPYLTAEMGGGMELSYHRRPVLTGDDTAAMELVKIGSGVTMYGYYMFHGGTNPNGKRTTLEESHATGYPNDMPVKSYDFQAPLGEFGEYHPAFRDVKVFHLFLHDFGADVAPMVASLPQRLPSSKTDRDTPRLAARTDGRRGFLFINNYERNYALPAHDGLQVRLKLASGTLDIPRRPLDIPGGAYIFWPVNMPVGGAVLEYATAQPLCRLRDPETYVFFAWPGIAPEFAIRDADGLSIEAPGAHIARHDGVIYVDRIEPGLAPAIRIHGHNGDAQVLVLSRDQARNAWKAVLGGRERLIISPAGLYFEGNRLHMISEDPARLTMDVFPKFDADDRPGGLSYMGMEGIFEGYAAHVTPIAVEAKVEKLADAHGLRPVKMSGDVATAPTDADFSCAARWRIRVPAAVPHLLLRISYVADVARIYAGNSLITDDFYNGTPWDVGLDNLPPAELQRGLELKILPLRADAPIYFDPGYRPAIPRGSDVVRLENIRVVPEYHVAAALRP
jgi:beta-galactosidase